MLGLLAELDAADLEAGVQPVAEDLVMVPGDVGDLGAAPRMVEHEAEHLVMAAVPVPGFAQLPAIHDVADQEQALAADTPEKVGQEIAAGTARSEMDIGQEDGPDSERGRARIGRG